MENDKEFCIPLKKLGRFYYFLKNTFLIFFEEKIEAWNLIGQKIKEIFYKQKNCLYFIEKKFSIQISLCYNREYEKSEIILINLEDFKLYSLILNLKFKEISYIHLTENFILFIGDIFGNVFKYSL